MDASGRLRPYDRGAAQGRLGGLAGAMGGDEDRARRVMPGTLDARETGCAQFGQVRFDAANKAVAVQEKAARF